MIPARPWPLRRRRRPGAGAGTLPAMSSWPPRSSCRRVALAVFGLALALHISAAAVAASLGFDLRGSVVFSEVTALLGGSIWISRRMGLDLPDAFGLRPAAPIHYGFAAAAAFPLQIAGGALQYAILQVWPGDGAGEFLERAMRELVRLESPGDWWMLFAAGVVVAAVCEEVLFRGLIQRLLARHGGWLRAAVLSGALFSAFHLDPVGFPARWLLGTYLGILVWRSGSLYPAVFAHAANNLVALYAVTATPEEPAVQDNWAAVGIASGIVVVVLVVLYLRQTPGTTPLPGRGSSRRQLGPDDGAPGSTESDSGDFNGAPTASGPRGIGPHRDSTRRTDRHGW